MNWYEALNNREWAIVLWLFTFIVLSLYRRDIRNAVKNCIKAFFVKPIIISIVLMFSYIALVVFELAYFRLWDTSQSKNTIFWCLTVAIPTMFDINKIGKDDAYFKKAIVDNVKLSLLLEYIIGLYVFSLSIELLIVPFSVLLGMLLVVSKSDKKYNKVEGCLNIIAALSGIAIIGHAVYSAYTDFSNLISYGTIIDFSSPVMLSLLFMPFIYMALIYSRYEDFYIRLPFFVKDNKLRKYIKLKAILSCRLNFKQLDKFLKNIARQRPNNRQEVLELLRSSKSN